MGEGERKKKRIAAFDNGTGSPCACNNADTFEERLLHARLVSPGVQLFGPMGG